ncbi:MAG: hypothetical protein RH982_03040 [Parvibaculum sp.]
MSLEISDINAFPYAGWLPTANGRLSFRHIGEAEHPSPSIYANVATERDRIILVYQERDFGDVLFPSILHFFGINGRFWFAIAAKSNDIPSESDSLSGTIYIYKSKSDWRSSGESAIRPKIYAINEISRSELPPRRDTEITACFNAAKGDLATTSDIRVAFSLKRDGEAYFSKPKFLDEQLEEASAEYATSLGHDFTKWIADQAYFFLRDITHRHRHHEPSEDTILILQNRDDDEFSWRRKILYSLHYQVIRAKRFSNTYSITQAMGILAYANSFYRVCERKLHSTPRYNICKSALQPASDEIPRFNSEEMLLSINAQIKQNDLVQSAQLVSATNRLSKATNIRTFALSLAAIIVGLMLTFIEPRIGPDGDATELKAYGDVIEANFPQLLGAVALFYLVVWTFTTHRFYEWRKDLLEMANVQRKKSILLLSSAGILVAVVTFHLGYDAISAMAKPFVSILAIFQQR